MKRLLFILFLTSSLSGIAQQSVIDSLIARLQEKHNDTDQVNTLNRLAWNLKHIDPDTSLTLSTRALSIAEAKDWKPGIANSLGKLANFYNIKSDYDLALAYFFKSVKENERLSKSSNRSLARVGKFGLAKNYGNIGITYNRQGYYSKAIQYFSKAFILNKELGRQKGIALNLGNLAIIYDKQGNSPKAMEYYFKSLKIHEDMANKNGIAMQLANIAALYTKQGNSERGLEYIFRAIKIDEELGDLYGLSADLGTVGINYLERDEYSRALHYMFRALEITRKMGNKNGISTNLINIGNIYKYQGDSAMTAHDLDYALKDRYPKAKKYYLEGMALAKELGVQVGITVSTGNLGALYCQIGEFQKAEEFLLSALELSKKIGARERTRSHYKSLTHLYDTINRPGEALDMYKLYILHRDSIENEENTKALIRTEMKYEYEKAAMLKEQGEKETARMEAEATSRRDNLQYSVILIAILVLFGSVLFLGFVNVSTRMAEGIIFFSFLILFEFLLVLADPYIDNWSGGAPGIKLLFNAGIAAFIFPAHAFFENRIKARLVKQ